LNDDVVVLLNLFSAIGGARGQFARDEYKTCRSVFPEVQLFGVRQAKNGYGIQNLILIAMKQPRTDWKSDYPEFIDELANRWTQPISDDLPVLTDDFAPTENYLLKLLK
jgi:hypothetical protein